MATTFEIRPEWLVGKYEHKKDACYGASGKLVRDTWCHFRPTAAKFLKIFRSAP